ncbi:MAG: hypothetical protein GDA35_03690 [Hyphomonadaceae bacterium]|nr:hypothetical protein [Hyphomonadaceae bacterium]
MTRHGAITGSRTAIIAIRATGAAPRIKAVKVDTDAATASQTANPRGTMPGIHIADHITGMAVAKITGPKITDHGRVFRYGAATVTDV